MLIGVYMVTRNLPLINLRDATEADLPALISIRSDEAHHRGRLRDAGSQGFRYFLLSSGQDAIGFVCLVFRRPASWLNANDTRHLPEINDLYLAEAWRGRGYGSAAVGVIEKITLEAGHEHLYISVEPVDNTRAYALYQRLGFKQIQPEPYVHIWGSLDIEGKLNTGELLLVDMVKPLNSSH